MRYYGEVKQFGEFSKGKYNDYGFITNIGDKHLEYEEIFFHRDELLFDINKVEEGLIVTFELHINNRRRSSAKSIRMIENEEDLQVIERCLDSEYPIVWLPVLNNYSELVPLDKGLEIVEKKLSTVIFGETSNLKKYIPNKYYKYPKIRSHLTPKDRFSICCKLLNDDNLNKTDKNELLTEVIGLLSQYSFSEDTIYNKVPKKLFIENEFLRSKISPLKYFNYLLDISKSSGQLSHEIVFVLKENNYKQFFLEQIVKTINTEKEIEELIQVLDAIPEDKRILRLKDLSTELKKNSSKIFKYLHPLDKVNVLWDKDENTVEDLWSQLDYKTKIFYLYKKAKYDQKIDFLSNVGESHPIIISVLEILWAKDNDILIDGGFNEIHKKIQDYIVDIAWNLDKDIDISPLLPECPFGYVKYCEGKPWKKDGKDFVFCPRKNDICNFETDKSQFKIYPNCELPWYSWSLLELLDYSNITPVVDKLNNPDQYVNRLSGWINRLDEIRERLKCTICGKPLLNNFRYSKNLAVYNSTVFYCKCGSSSNKNVYLSHCWACRVIIDSRENNYKYEEYYLCLKCGSGPKASSSYTQGSMCPQCGSKKMTNTDLYNREFRCLICGHSIRIPPPHKLTGNKMIDEQFIENNDIFNI